MTERWAHRGLVVQAPVPVAWAVSHAALPVVHPDGAPAPGLRLYVATRDAGGRSQIAAGRMTLETGEASFDPEPAVTSGAAGAFDELGATTSCVVTDGNRVHLFYTGWGRSPDRPFTLAIGCAVSADGGHSFEKPTEGLPLVTAHGPGRELAASPAVLVEDGLWRMWYVAGTGWEVHEGRPRPTYRVDYAESTDGSTWTPTGVVCLDPRWWGDVGIARPCVVAAEPGYRMWFCTRGASYRIGYAESTDGIEWQPGPEPFAFRPSGEAWDAEMQAYPFVLRHDGAWHMLYNGNGFGRTGVGHAVAG